mmetsp:Transcript_41203/g.74485  ORF Transcript_41203/g.74485 Transcript_41203/m.74485 type:complete len:603 (-) Transcript_41203:18-1826(-)
MPVLGSTSGQTGRIIPELLVPREDESVLEAERELALYLSRQSGNAGPSLEEPGTTCGRLAQELQSSRGLQPCNGNLSWKEREHIVSEVQHLGQRILSHDALIEQLWRELATVPAEQSSLAAENKRLETEAAESEAELERLLMEQRALSAEAVECRRLVQGLQQERKVLVARVGEAQRSEASAREGNKITQLALVAERSHGAELHKSYEGEIARRETALQAAEARAAVAAQHLQQLKDGHSAAGTEAAAVAREAAAEAEALRLQRQKLEAKLLEEEELLKAATMHDQSLAVELATAREELEAMELATQSLALEVTESEQRTDATERKARGIARELLQTSEVVKQLRKDVAAAQGMRSDLRAARIQEGELEQAWRKCKQEQDHPNAADGTRFSSAGADVTSVSLFASQSRAHAMLNTIPPPASSAGAELRELRASQERAANTALRTAWETEVKEHQETAAELSATEAEWAASQMWLKRLVAVTQRWRDELASSMGKPLAAGAGPGARELLEPAASDALPVPPHASDFSSDATLPRAVQQLIDCVQALSIESMRRLDAARCSPQLASTSNPASAREMEGRAAAGELATNSPTSLLVPGVDNIAAG